MHDAVEEAVAFAIAVAAVEMIVEDIEEIGDVRNQREECEALEGSVSLLE